MKTAATVPARSSSLRGGSRRGSDSADCTASDQGRQGRLHQAPFDGDEHMVERPETGRRSRVGVDLAATSRGARLTPANVATRGIPGSGFVAACSVQRGRRRPSRRRARRRPSPGWSEPGPRRGDSAR